MLISMVVSHRHIFMYVKLKYLESVRVPLIVLSAQPNIAACLSFFLDLSK